MIHASELHGYLYLQVYFSKGPDRGGLIYSDPMWIKEFNQFLNDHGEAIEFNYTEQGMQGIDYVSLESTTPVTPQENDDFVCFCYKFNRLLTP